MLSKYRLDLSMLLLMVITLVIWFLKDISFIYGFIIYLLIFLFLIIKKRPISHFFVVIMFSVMSLQQDDTGIFKMDYALVLVLLVYTLILCIRNKRISIGNLLFPLVLFLLYSMISIAWTPVKADGLHGLVGMLEGYIIYLVLTNGNFIINKEDLLKLSKTVTYVMLTLTIQIMYIYFTIGINEVFINKFHIDLGWGFSNLIATIFVILIPIASYKYLNKEKYYPIYFILDLFNFIGLILTLSRGAYLGIFVSGLLFIVFFVRKQVLIRYGSIVGGCLVLGTALLFILKKQVVFFNLLKDKFFNINFVGDSGRKEIYEVALKSFVDNIIFGNGLKSSKYLISTNLDASSAVHFHNFILQIAATLGIVGLCFFAYLVFKWYKVLYKPKDQFVVLGALSIIGALVHQLFDVSFDLYYFGIFFYGIISIVEIYRHNLDDDDLKIKHYIFHKTKDKLVE